MCNSHQSSTDLRGMHMPVTGCGAQASSHVFGRLSRLTGVMYGFREAVRPMLAWHIIHANAS